MLRLRFVLATVLIFLGAGPVQAQRTATPSLLVLANNQGIFTCAVDVAIFNFGSVDADGTDHGTPNVAALGRNGANTGGMYQTTPGAIGWICRAAPPSTVDLALTSLATDHVGGLDPDNLEARVPDVAGGTSAGFQPFTSQAALLTGMAVGNAGAAVNGSLDLRLSIFDTDPMGSDVWVVRLRASGTP